MRSIFTGVLTTASPVNLLWSFVPGSTLGTLRISSMDVTLVSASTGFMNASLFDYSGVEKIKTKPIAFGYIPKTFKIAMPKSTDFGPPTPSGSAFQLNTSGTVTVDINYSVVLNYSIKND
jgi:hypothetical protein